MAERILFEHPLRPGRVAILVPDANCGLSIADIAAKDVPQGVPYEIVDEADIPTDRTFRNAWTKAGKSIATDMPKARDIWRDRMREVRAPLLAALDVAYLKADEEGKLAVKAGIAAQKAALRDVTQDAAIEAAATPEDLKTVWPDILGPKP